MNIGREGWEEEERRGREILRGGRIRRGEGEEERIDGKGKERKRGKEEYNIIVI